MEVRIIEKYISRRRFIEMGLISAVGFSLLGCSSFSEPIIPENDRGIPEEPSVEGTGIDVILNTDLFYPRFCTRRQRISGDFDDFFDLLCMFGLHCRNEINLRMVVLDRPEEQEHRPGSVLVDRLNQITGAQIPSGVSHIALLEGLRSSPGPVTVVMVGSLTDLWQAYVEDPELCRSKIKEVWVFAGDAQDNPVRQHRDGKDYHPQGLEYNVAMDPGAFTGIMGSDLPIVWIPCYDGGLVEVHADGVNKVHGSYHLSQYGVLLSESIQQVNELVLEAKSSELSEGGLYDWDTLMGNHRSFFGVGIFRSISRPELDYPFRFIDAEITANENGTISRGGSKPVKLFERIDQPGFYDRITQISAEVIGFVQEG